MKENRYIKVKANCILPKAYIFNTEEKLLHYTEFRYCGQTSVFITPDSIISLNENSIGNLPATNTLDVKLYNQIGDLIIPTSYTFSGGVFSMVIDPEIVPCLPSPISIDGIYIDDLPNTDPLDIKVVDQNGNPITPISSALAGGVATVGVNTGSTCPPTEITFKNTENTTIGSTIVTPCDVDRDEIFIDETYNIYMDGVLSTTFTLPIYKNETINLMI